MMTFPKPSRGGRQREKSRQRRRETQVVRSVRPQVAARDGSCRLHTALFALQFNEPLRWSALMAAFGLCSGPSEWSHFGAQKRAHTRGQDPERRHTTAGSLMLCRSHHKGGKVSYDSGTLQICALTLNGCDGPLRFMSGGAVYAEASA